MHLESVFEGLPGAEINGVCCEGDFLTVFCPFISEHAKFEVCQGGGDLFILEWINICVEVIVVGEAGPEGICFG